MRIYISGPVTKATPEQLENFARAKEWLVERGQTVWVPTDHIPRWAGHDAAMSRCLAELRSGYDVICLLPGWYDSAGATEELDEAKELGMQVMLWEVSR